MPRADGRSILPLFSDPQAPWRDYLFLHHHDTQNAPGVWRGVITKDRKYVIRASGTEILYNRANDPYEVSPIRETQTLTELRAKLAQLRGCAGETCRTAEGE
jgi:hypothetical protein